MSTVLEVMTAAVEEHGKEATAAFVEEKAGEVPDAIERFVNDRFALVGGIEILPALTVNDMRVMFDRPLKIMRTLAGLTEAEAAQVMGWSIEQVRAAEQLDEIPVGFVSLAEFMAGLAKLACTLAARLSGKYRHEAWKGGDDAGLDAAELLASLWACSGGGLLQRKGIEVEFWP